MRREVRDPIVQKWGASPPSNGRCEECLTFTAKRRKRCEYCGKYLCVRCRKHHNTYRCQPEEGASR